MDILTTKHDRKNRTNNNTVRCGVNRQQFFTTMYNNHIICVSLFLLLRFGNVANAGEQRFAMQPQDQTAVVGSRVTLPCRVIDKSGMLQWTKDDFGLGTHRNLSGFDRYSMVGSDEEGDFSLDIFPVMLDDDARYQCQVSPGPLGEPGIRSEYATLSVLVPPEAPRISQGSVLTTTEDREIELECISAAGKPAAEITWIDGHGTVMTHGVENIITNLPDGRRFTVKSILKLTPKREHHNTTFTCQAQNTAERTHRIAHIKLEVKYAPKVTVKILSGATSNGRIPEGAEVHFGCTADANPPDVEYRWYLNDKLIIGDYTTEMVIHNVTREHHDNIVKCEVHNPVGKSEESETLDVTYAPIFRTKPQSVQAESGATVTLTCDVDSNPPAEIVWSHENSAPTYRSKVIGGGSSSEEQNSWDGVERMRMSASSERIIGSSKRRGGNREDRLRTESSNTNLTLSVDHRTSGRYYCRASVAGFPEIGAEAYVYLKGPPTIISHKTQFGIEGDNVRVECIAFSIPKPEHVIWSFNGRDVDFNDQDYSILEDPLPEGVKSTLIIRESQQKHFGMYNCSVTNPYGSDVVEINLMPQKSFPMLLIITGIIFGVIIIIIITMIIFLCQRQSKKNPEGDTNTIEKQTQQSDRSSNISDLKLDLRAGSSVSNMDYTTGATNIGRCGDSDAGSEATHGPTGGVPLAGPVPLSLDTEYRYSAEYVEPSFPPKNDGQNNNGYVPYVDYSRDYNPPPLLQPALQSTLDSSRESLQSTRLQLNSLQATNNHINANTHSNLITSQNSLLNSLHNNPYTTNSVALNDLNPSYVTMANGSIDPRYSATYGNPYLRNTNVGLPPPNTAILAATPAPPPYTRDASARTSLVQQQQQQANGAVPQVARLPNSPNGTHIVPTSNNMASVKRGTLATHV